MCRRWMIRDIDVIVSHTYICISGQSSTHISFIMCRIGPGTAFHTWLIAVRGRRPNSQPTRATASHAGNHFSAATRLDGDVSRVGFEVQ